MAVYPKRKTPLTQVVGNHKISLTGKERVYSRKDTERIVRLSRKAKTEEDFVELGEYVLKATKLSDARPVQYVEEQ